MSSNRFTSSSSISFSSTSNTTTSDGQTMTGYRTSHQSTSDPIKGTTVQTSSQKIGEPAVQETRHYDPQGRELPQGSTAGRRIEDVSETQAERDAAYEERMEEEYAKREGGA